MEPVDTSGLVYKERQLPVHPVDQPFRYLGVLLTRTLDFKHEKEKVLRETDARLVGGTFQGSLFFVTNRARNCREVGHHRVRISA